MNKRTLTTSLLALAAAGGLLLAGCSSDDGASEDLRGEVVQTYADGVHASYLASLTSAQAMDQAIDAFLAAPSEETLAAAKQAWLAARDDYSPTEAFRFYGGPIDDDDGPDHPLGTEIDHLDDDVCNPPSDDEPDLPLGVEITHLDDDEPEAPPSDAAGRHSRPWG